MKPQRGFVAERALAQHSAALLRPGPGPGSDIADLVGGLERAGQRIAKALPGALAPLIGDVRLKIAHATPQQASFGDYAVNSAPLAANCLFSAGAGAGAGAAPFLVVIDAAAVFALVDRAFGGAGLPPETTPRAFPLAAELAIERLEALLGQAIATALGGKAEAIHPLRRDGDLAQLAPFASDTMLAVLSLKIEEASRATWTIDLAFPLATLETLFASGDQPASRPHSAPRTPDPHAEPFATLPLQLLAVLVDMALPLSALSQLEVGHVLPVMVARRVPLRIGDVTVAHGSIGAADDRVAIQILS